MIHENMHEVLVPTKGYIIFPCRKKIKRVILAMSVFFTLEGST